VSDYLNHRLSIWKESPSLAENVCEYDHQIGGGGGEGSYSHGSSSGQFHYPSGLLLLNSSLLPSLAVVDSSNHRLQFFT